MQITNPAVAVSSLNMTDIGGNTILAGFGIDGLGALRVSPAALAAGDDTANQSFTTSGAATVIPAATNVNGIIIKRYSRIIIGSTAGVITALLKATAPTSYTDGECILAASAQGVADVLGANVYVPAGIGLFTFNQGAAGDILIAYKLL